jgi:hypothetical protein
MTDITTGNKNYIAHLQLICAQLHMRYKLNNADIQSAMCKNTGDVLIYFAFISACQLQAQYAQSDESSDFNDVFARVTKLLDLKKTEIGFAFQRIHTKYIDDPKFALLQTVLPLVLLVHQQLIVKDNDHDPDPNGYSLGTQSHINQNIILEAVHDVWVLNTVLPVQASGCALKVPADAGKYMYLCHFANYQGRDATHVGKIMRQAAALQFAIRAISSGDPIPFDLRAINGLQPKDVVNALLREPKPVVRTGGRYQIGGRNVDDCIIYVGPRGGKYIKRNGILVSLARIQRKA